MHPDIPQPAVKYKENEDKRLTATVIESNRKIKREKI